MIKIVDLIKVIPPSIREKMIYFKGLKKKSKIIEEINDLSRNEVNALYSSINDKNNWKNSFINLSIATDNRGIELAREFYKSNIRCIKKSISINEDNIFLICVAKNEYENLTSLFSYYSKLGIKNFVLIDNNSDDNTIEYFSNNNNISIFEVEDKYTSIRRQAWINKVISMIGYNKWYLVIDSDEYLTYNECENKKINSLIEYCQKNKIKRMQSLMVDMYPKEIVFNNEKIDFLSEYKYFDKDTYVKDDGKDSLLLNCYKGGVRKRVFSNNETLINPWLTKYPLIYFENGDIQYQSHMSFPFYKNFQSNNNLVIRHYKFLPTDFQKYEERKKMGNFAGGSNEYKAYIKEMEKGKIQFYNSNNSIEFKNSDSFYEIDILKRINWN